MAVSESTRRNIDKQIRGRDGKVIGASPTMKIVEAINECFKAIRAQHPDVPNLSLVVGTSSRRAHGHFHANTWQLGEERVHEIMLSGETLRRSAEDVFGVLLHEAAHSIAQVRGIQDTSRQGRFHNTRFKLLAEEVGIVVEKVPGIGWSETSVPSKTRKLYQRQITLLRRALKTYRVPRYEGEPPPPKKTTIKLQTASGRTLTVPILFHEQGAIFDAITGEAFEPVES